MKTPLLEARDLTCGYGKCEVLSGVNLDVQPGKVLALIGPNGAGKTTLLHTLGGLLPALAGDVYCEGVPLRGKHARATARAIALAPQRVTPSAWPLSVSEAVSLGRAPHRGWFMPLTREDKQVIDASMARMGIATLAGRMLSTLSGGEARRVVLARALAQTPKILLLDEPATYLDIKYQSELVSLVRALAHEDGLAVVLTLHDLALVTLCADTVALVAGGALRLTGAVGEVLREDVLRPVYGENLEVFAHPKSGLPVVLPRIAE
ncbi:MAG: ABC transporter ATP-binding protein [Opitutaceae bacterium]|jgi:iron complex transport system ATP-binding protein|nr:ABC transporter ATP-binding protein [Opitutaceae bacterium]